MGDRRRALCKVCGKHRSEVGELSWTGKCTQHSDEALRSNIDQMMDRRGPNFDRWRYQMVLCAHPELVDALGPKP